MADGTVGLKDVLEGELQPVQELSGDLQLPKERVVAEDYDRLRNRPEINGFTVEGSKISSDYKLQDKMHELTVQEIEKILYSD